MAITKLMTRDDIYRQLQSLPPRPPPPPADISINLSVEPSIVDPTGTDITLTWASNAPSLTAGGGWSGSRGSNGSEVLTAVKTNTTYTLTGGAGGASVTASVTVTANAIAVLTAAPDSKLVIEDLREEAWIAYDGEPSALRRATLYPTDDATTDSREEILLPNDIVTVEIIALDGKLAASDISIQPRDQNDHPTMYLDLKSGVRRASIKTDGSFSNWFFLTPRPDHAGVFRFCCEKACEVEFANFNDTSQVLHFKQFDTPTIAILDDLYQDVDVWRVRRLPSAEMGYGEAEMAPISDAGAGSGSGGA